MYLKTVNGIISSDVTHTVHTTSISLQTYMIRFSNVTLMAM